MFINYIEEPHKGTCAACHHYDAPDGVSLCESCTNAFSIADEEMAAVWAEIDKEETRQRWKALRALFTPSRMERGFCSRWYDMRARLRCAVCLIFARWHCDGDGTAGHEYEVMASWDCQNEYAGWSGMFVSVHETAWRCQVFRDGDWNM